MRYDDLTAADDGNQDKASVSDASDLPWELSRCATNPTEPLSGNRSSSNEKRASREKASPRKRTKTETPPEGSSEDEETEREEGNADWTPEELLEVEQEKGECLFDLQELLI